EAVQALDAALAVVAGEAHVLLGVQAGAAALGTGPADGGDDEVPLAEAGAVRGLLHAAEVLVAEDQVRAAGGRRAELRRLDVHVRPADARLQDTDEGLALLRARVGEVVADLEAVRLAGDDGDRTHRRGDFTTKRRAAGARRGRGLPSFLVGVRAAVLD